MIETDPVFVHAEFAKKIERVRRYSLNQRRGNEHWINPLLSQFDLIQARDTSADPRHDRKSIEECKLLERMGRVIAEINGAAGYHVLEMLEYLAPQKKVCRVSFDRNRIQHKMELVIENEGILLMFSSARRISTRWDRYFSRGSKKDNSTVVWEQIIRPGEVLDQNIQAWLSYLLSGLDKKFRLDQILHGSPVPEADLSTILRKLSA